jgi:hypothetical protein
VQKEAPSARQADKGTRVGDGSNLIGPGVTDPQGGVPAPNPDLDATATAVTSEEVEDPTSDPGEEAVDNGGPDLELEPDDPRDPTWKLKRKLPGKGVNPTHPKTRTKGPKGEVMDVVDIHHHCGPYNPRLGVEEQVGKEIAKMHKPGVEVVSSRHQRVRKRPDFYQAGYS